MKTLLGIPYYDKISDKTLQSIDNVRRQIPNITLRKIKGSLVTTARNLLISENPSLYEDINNYEVIVQVDSDIEFTVNQFKSLLNKVKKYKVISGLYELRQTNGISCAEIADRKYLKMSASGVRKIQSSGAGFLFIDASILKNIEKPWFEQIKIIEDNKYKLTGEDAGFFIKAREAGYQGYVDCDCKVIHNWKNK